MHRSRPVIAIVFWLTATAASPGAVPPADQGPQQPPAWQAVFSDPDAWQFPSLEDFQGWVEPYPGTQAPFATAVFKHANYKLGEGAIDVTLPKTEGLLRLKRPLEPGKAVRLRLVDLPPTIIAWSGTAGAVIEADFDAALFGYRFHGSTATRAGDNPRPESRSLVATSGARVFGCGFFGARQGVGRFQPLLDLAHHDGRLILSSGDITLVEVPLAEPPREILFDGSMLCGGIEIVPFVPPPRPASRLAATEGWKPADLDWQVVGCGADGKAEPMRLTRAADGSVRLAQPADKPAAAIAALWKIPPGPRGPREIIVHLEKCSPGAGLCLFGPDGKPKTVVGLVKPKGVADANGLLVDFWPTAESRLEGGDAKRAGAPWIQGDAVWFRLRFGPRPCVVYAVSGDGEHWAELGKQTDGVPPTGVGIYAPAVAKAGVTLKSLAAADFPGLAALVPEDLVAVADKAVPDAAVADPAAWEEQVRAAKPEPVAADHWAAIVATRSLARQANSPTLDVALLGHLHRYALRDELPLEARIAICDDITRLWCDTGGWNSTNILGVYALVGERLLAADDFAGLERLRRAVIDSPACVGGGAWFDPLHQQARWLERLAIAGPVEEYARVAMRASFGFTEVFGHYRSRMGLASWCLHDIATRLGAAALVKGGRPPEVSYYLGGLNSWEPALMIGQRTELGIEAANGLSDFAQQVGERNWPAAQQALDRVGQALADDPDRGVIGLPGDPERYVSPRLFMAAIVDAEPEFLEHMRSVEEAKAALRLQMLRAAGDARGMAAAALAFAGTPSAAEAYAWLGDREIAAGRFAQGREWYRWGLRFGAGEQAARLEAGERFAGVLNGGPVAGPGPHVGPLTGPEAEAVEKDLLAARLCIVRTMHTESINHGPGVTFMQSGAQIPGRPSIGAWLDYGLGNVQDDLPAFVVLVTKNKGGQPLMSHLWGAGFLPTKHQAVRFRSGADPVLYVNNPPGVSAESRRQALDGLRALHEHQLATLPDAEIAARIANHEMAFRMQASVPEVANLADEPQHVLDRYGPDAKDPGTFAANCLLARRLAERGVRFIQLYHQDWDHHGGLKKGLADECRQTDQPTAALVEDLAMRGMLDDTLVVWGGEFGRTNYCQGLYKPGQDFGRDHHPRCFTIWMAGGGVKPGTTYGTTDDYGYNIVDGGVHVHDFHATMLHLLGIDHERLTYKFQGRRYRLTDVHGKVVKGILA